MKRFFYIDISLLVLFELANVFFIMPMPGSQASERITACFAPMTCVLPES
jgi:hypothetical protein